VITFWFSDPFGRATGKGTLSAFEMYDAPSPFVWNDAAFRVPEVDDHVVYEMNAKPCLSVSARPTRGSQLWGGISRPIERIACLVRS